MSLRYIGQLRGLTTKSISNAIQSNNIKTDGSLKYQFDVKPIIGLEVHAQLKVNSKLFSQGANNVQAPPNTQLDLLDIALPGTLPKLNISAIRSAILTALGLNCSIQDVIHFDRKNYFYADMPAGYQITQYNKPIAKNGHIDFIVSPYQRSGSAHSQPYDIIKYLYKDDKQISRRQFEPYMKRSNIKQIQLEQDSAKTLSQSGQNGLEISSLIDYNRCGTALIEIVFEPDLTSPHEASSLIRELIMLLRVLDVCDCELQEGLLRVDANVSVASIDGQVFDQQLAKRVELKNLNSLKSLNRAIQSELRRQAELLSHGEKVVQESRSYDSRTDRTMPLRLKEDAIDYRYMPEPNLPPLSIDQEMAQEIGAQLSELELPSTLRERFRSKYDLDYETIAELMAEPGLSGYFEQIMQLSGRSGIDYDRHTLADFLCYAVICLKRVEISSIEIDLSHVDSEFWQRFHPELMQDLFDRISSDRISYCDALGVMKTMLVGSEPQTPKEIVERLGLTLINDEKKIRAACEQLAKGMKNISKKYFSTGERKYLRLMLDKLIELYNGQLSIRKSIECLENMRQEWPEEKKKKKTD